ncbi:ArsR family transcriptional regulator [Rhodococcus hoagii]|nr:ArsR family transcriptional regulator [Prescottella equi]MBM4719674.1 ArsR family transcriptional regulator [Prescottella equi]NKU37464.1 ArsR family transcriptional regulator [Prescottella equi]
MWLLLHPDHEYTVSDLARRIAAPLSTVHSEVVRLDKAALIDSRTLGRNRLVRANTQHPAAKPLAQLLRTTFGPRAVIAEEFELPAAERVIIFGSWAARHEGEDGPPPNDIDVLVVGDHVDRTEVYAAADRAQARIGIEVNPLVRTTDEWNHPEDDPLLIEINAAPHVVVIDNAQPVAAR